MSRTLQQPSISALVGRCEPEPAPSLAYSQPAMRELLDQPSLLRVAAWQSPIDQCHIIATIELVA